jgi:hypothetical protein
MGRRLPDGRSRAPRYDEHPYVLDETFVDHNRACGPGSYILNRAGSEHQASTPDGCNLPHDSFVTVAIGRARGVGSNAAPQICSGSLPALSVRSADARILEYAKKSSNSGYNFDRCSRSHEMAGAVT